MSGIRFPFSNWFKRKSPRESGEQTEEEYHQASQPPPVESAHQVDGSSSIQADLPPGSSTSPDAVEGVNDAVLSERVRLTVEGILGNEALTAELDDQAANALLDWVIGCAKDIALSTAGLGNPQAEEVMYPRLRALNKMARLVARWAAAGQRGETEEQVPLLAQVAAQARMVYPADQLIPDFHLSQEILQQDPAQAIASLRNLIEGGLSY